MADMCHCPIQTKCPNIELAVATEEASKEESGYAFDSAYSK